jgi:AraC-like DNA-binding protein
VEVVARLSAPLLAHLRTVATREHLVHAADDWNVLRTLVRERPIDVAVVDPRADGTSGVDAVATILATYPSLPLVVYTSLSSETVKATVELAKLGVQHVVLRGFDDEPRRFLELLERQPAFAMTEAVLQRIGGSLARLPLPLARAITQLFRSPLGFDDVEDLAAAAGMTRRTLDRWLERVDLGSGKRLVAGARLLRAYHYMRDPGYELLDVVRKLGYSSPRVFARQVRAATGLTPSVLRDVLQPEEFIMQLTALMLDRSVRPEGLRLTDGDASGLADVAGEAPDVL